MRRELLELKKICRMCTFFPAIRRKLLIELDMKGIEKWGRKACVCLRVVAMTQKQYQSIDQTFGAWSGDYFEMVKYN